jgi:hypothetical protein
MEVAPCRNLKGQFPKYISISWQKYIFIHGLSGQQFMSVPLTVFKSSCSSGAQG